MFAIKKLNRKILFELSSLNKFNFTTLLLNLVFLPRQAIFVQKENKMNQSFCMN